MLVRDEASDRTVTEGGLYSVPLNDMLHVQPPPSVPSRMCELSLQ